MAVSSLGTLTRQRIEKAEQQPPNNALDPGDMESPPLSPSSGTAGRAESWTRIWGSEDHRCQHGS